MLYDSSAKQSGETAAEPTVLPREHGDEQKSDPLSPKKRKPGKEDLQVSSSDPASNGDDAKACRRISLGRREKAVISAKVIGSAFGTGPHSLGKILFEKEPSSQLALGMRKSPCQGGGIPKSDSVT